MRKGFYKTKTFWSFLVIVVASILTIVVRITYKGAVAPLTDKVKTLDITFPMHKLSTERTHYMCTSFKMPKSAYVSKMEIIDNVNKPSVMHHMLVLSSVRDFGTCPFDCMDMPEISGFNWAWAIGMDNLELAEDQYMALHDVVVIQMHYDNYAGWDDVVDNGSGVRIHYTEKEPYNKDLVSTLSAGAQVVGNWEIAPSIKNTTIVFDTKVDLIDDVVVRGYFLHMHELGVKARMEIYRNGKFLSFVGCMGYKERYGVDEQGVNGCLPYNYDFDYQKEIVIQEGDVVLKPGDVLRMICEMDSSNKIDVTVPGFATNNEMCQNHMTVYPTENLAQLGTLTSEPTLLISDGTTIVDRTTS